MESAGENYRLLVEVGEESFLETVKDDYSDVRIKCLTYF